MSATLQKVRFGFTQSGIPGLFTGFTMACPLTKLQEFSGETTPNGFVIYCKSREGLDQIHDLCKRMGFEFEGF